MKAAPVIRIGSRGSRLALAQAGQVRDRLRRLFPRVRFEITVIRTRGDQYQSVELFRRTGTGVFTKELERHLLSGRIDLAVHSLKDLPTDLPRALTLGGFPEREDTRDVLVTANGRTLRTLRRSARVGTGSPRRKSQLAAARPDLELVDIRGNLDTRVGRVLDRGDLDAVVLASAGLRRIRRYARHARPIPERQLLPAVGQAALGIEIRSNDAVAARLAAALDHPPTRTRVLAERAFLRRLHGGCRVPVGVRSSMKGKRLFLEAAVFSVDSPSRLQAALSGPADAPERLGERLARRLLERGAGRLLARARRRRP